MASDIDTVYRDNKIKGDIHSGEHWPDKPEIRALLKGLFGAASNPSIVKKTKAALLLVTPTSEDFGGVVLDDPNPANNGYYSRVAGVWTFGRGFPDTFAKVVLSGTGTAQTGGVSAGVSPASVEVFYARVVTANTGPLTLAIGGEPPREVLNLAGNPMAAGEWTGTVLFELNDAGKYQLVTDAGAAASAAASASAANVDADRAEAAAALALSATGRLNFKTVADLLADTTLAYVAAPGKVVVGVSDVVEAEGFRYSVASAGAADQHVTTAGGVRLYALPGEGGFDLRQWRVSTLPIADNAPVITLAMEVAATAGRPLHVGARGTVWHCTGTVAPLVANRRLKITGEAKLLFSGSGYLNISGTATDLTFVATAVAKGAKTLPVSSAAGFAVGDKIVVEDRRDSSFSPTQHTGREAYHAGDFNRIAGIAGNILTLERPLRDSYPALSTSRVYKTDPVELVTSSFEVEASDTPTAACLVSCAVRSQINMHVRGGNQYAAFFNRLWLSEVRGGRYIHTAPDTGNNYGLVVGNAQDCNFFDVYAYGTRRGIATGTGGGPAGICMRNVWFIGGSSDNGTDILGSADLHGDADDCGFIGHRATFFDIGGRSSKVIDCEATPRGAVSPVSWTELVGGDFVVRNLKVTRPAGAAFTDIISGRNSAQLAAIKENYSITVDGVTVTDGAGLVGIVGFYHAAASPVRAEVFVDNVKVLGGAVASSFRLLNSTVQNVASHPGGVAAPVSLVVGDNCVWPFANTHFWMLTSGTHTGCRCWAPSTTFSTSFTVLSADTRAPVQSFSFVGYPFAPKGEISPYGLNSAAGVLFFGNVDTLTQSALTGTITTGKSTDTPGADRTLQARVEVSMRGAISA